MVVPVIDNQSVAILETRFINQVTNWENCKQEAASAGFRWSFPCAKAMATNWPTFFQTSLMGISKIQEAETNAVQVNCEKWFATPKDAERTTMKDLDVPSHKDLEAKKYLQRTVEAVGSSQDHTKQEVAKAQRVKKAQYMTPERVGFLNAQRGDDKSFVSESYGVEVAANCKSESAIGPSNNAAVCCTCRRDFFVDEVPQVEYCIRPGCGHAMCADWCIPVRVASGPLCGCCLHPRREEAHEEVLEEAHEEVL